MYSLDKVTKENSGLSFCLTDCGPSEGCSPDDYYGTDDDSSDDGKSEK